MSTEYDIICHETQEGYELGKGPWSDPEFELAVARRDSVSLVELMVDSGFSPSYAARVAAEILRFVEERPSFAVINDASSEIFVVDDERLEKLKAAWKPLSSYGFDIYRRVGSRYDKTEQSTSGSAYQRCDLDPEDCERSGCRAVDT